MNIATISVPTLIDTLNKPLQVYFKNPELADQHAWWLLSGVTSKTKAYLLSSKAIKLTEHEFQTLQEWVIDLTVHHKPIAYILGTVPFADLTLAIEPPVLIPRPETESWVLALIEQLSALADYPLRILDVGTGSGCIAMAFAYALPEAQIIAVDLSERALEVAQANADRYALDNITFLSSDLFEQLPADTYFDLIVSNPPYIDPASWGSLDASVTHWEDHNALVSDEQGYSHLFKIISQVPFYLKPNFDLRTLHIPNLVVEIGANQGAVTADYMKEQGAERVEVETDLAGKDRVVKGYFHVVDRESAHE